MLPRSIRAAKYGLDSLMVGTYRDIVTIEIVLKVTDGPDHSQCLQISDGVPRFCDCQGATGVGQRMELPI